MCTVVYYYFTCYHFVHVATDSGEHDRIKMFVSLFGWWCFITTVVSVVQGWSQTSLPAASRRQQQQPENRLELVQQAMDLTKQGAGDIALAYSATNLWNRILNADNNNDNSSSEKMPSNDLPDPIRAICYALYASCLVRVGRDDDALIVYDNALSLKQYLQTDARTAVEIGKANSLQRLLQYEQAAQQFLEAGE